MLELDAKQKVLIAFYTEYQKDVPNIRVAITNKSLGLDFDVFKIALTKLCNEGLINGVNIVWAGDNNVPFATIMHEAMMTSYGIQYVEEKLNIDLSLSGEEKVKSVLKSSAEWGWDQLKDIGSKVLAEIVKAQAGI